MRIDVDSVRLPAFALAEEHRPFDSEVHAHRKHQLLYAEAGTLQLITDDGTWLLPPQRAALIRARTNHRVRARGPVSLRTIYFGDRAALPRESAVVVFAVSDVLRELILYSMKFGVRTPTRGAGRNFFGAIAELVSESARDPRRYRLPTARSPELARAMDLLLDDLEKPPSLASLARRVGLSPRTLERRFAVEAGVGARAFLRTARVLRAMELLARPRATVTEVALAVGFQSLSSFSRAFAEIAGERPRAHRRGAP